MNIDSVNKRIRVRRDIAGVATAFAHQSGDILTENPRRFTINTGFQTTTQYEIDRTLYFEPEDLFQPKTLTNSSKYYRGFH